MSVGSDTRNVASKLFGKACEIKLAAPFSLTLLDMFLSKQLAAILRI